MPDVLPKTFAWIPLGYLCVYLEQYSPSPFHEALLGVELYVEVGLLHPWASCHVRNMPHDHDLVA